MTTLVEFHGRLSRSDKRPANPGRYDLLFQLHPTGEGAAVLWSETLKGVDVAPGGFYYVILGLKAPLSAGLFTSTPRWLSVRVIASGKKADEHSSRVPILGTGVALAEQVQSIEGRLAQLEHVLSGAESRSGRGTGRLRDWLDELTTRLSTLESRLQDEESPRQVAEILRRLEEIDGEEGRLTRMEDELEDIVGPDGDIVDLNERMDRLEGRAPELIANLRAREGESGRERLERLDQSIQSVRDRVADVDRAVEALRTALGELRETPPPTPEAIGALKRSGDTMSGALTISRGGLEVASGGISSRSAEISTLEVTNSVKTPKLLVDAVELRGDLSVDSPRRVLQVRMVEGRHGSARRDGPLHLNTRSGAEVVVGNEEGRGGLEVHGPVRAESLVSPAGCVALVFDVADAPAEGALVRLGGGRARLAAAEDAPGALGVVVTGPALLLGGALGSGRVAVAVSGVASCLADASAGPIRAGDLLGCGPTPGHAGALIEPTGAILGRALEGLDAGRGPIRVLLGSR